MPGTVMDTGPKFGVTLQIKCFQAFRKVYFFVRKKEPFLVY